MKTKINLGEFSFVVLSEVAAVSIAQIQRERIRHPRLQEKEIKYFVTVILKSGEQKRSGDLSFDDAKGMYNNFYQNI